MLTISSNKLVPPPLSLSFSLSFYLYLIFEGGIGARTPAHINTRVHTNVHTRSVSNFHLGGGRCAYLLLQVMLAECTESMDIHISTRMPAYTILFNIILIHGMSPSNLQSSTLVRKRLSVSDNYRAIALSSPLCKVGST